jgi:hypothetical protein
MSVYPGSGPSTPEVTPLLPALLFILSTRCLTRLLKLYCLDVEEEEFDLPSLRVQAPLYRRGLVTVLVSGCLAASSSVAAVLTWTPPSSGLLSRRRPLYKVPFPLGPAYSEHMLLVCLGSFHGGGACPLVGGSRAWLASRWSSASVDLVRATLLLIKHPLEGFRHLCRLGPSMMKSPAGYWRSRPFG